MFHPTAVFRRVLDLVPLTRFGAIPPVVWSKGYARVCDYAGDRHYGNSHTESRQPHDFFRQHYADSCGLVWVRLSSAIRSADNDLARFAAVAPTVSRPFSLITTDGDVSVPGELDPQAVRRLLEHPLLEAWYTQNYDGTLPHPKFRPIPIGFDFHSRRRKRLNTPHKIFRRLQRVRARALPLRGRDLSIFCDVHLSTNPSRFGDPRQQAFETLRACPHVTLLPRWLPIVDAWKTYARHAFAISTHGNGLDCHRTWELLLLGCIVITRTSSLDPLYRDLPVVIVQSWEECLDPHNLRFWFEKYAPLTDHAHILRKLHYHHWLPAATRRISISAA